MTGESPAPIEGVAKVKIGEEHYVNEATIELLQRRIESQVWASFWKMFGLPMTGGGIVAVILAAIYFIPAQVGKVIEENSAIKSMVSDAVETYLEDKEKGQSFLVRETEQSVKKELPGVIGRQLNTDEVARLIGDKLPASVEGYLNGAEGKQVVINQLPVAVSTYMSSDEGSKVLSREVQSQFSSEEIKKLVTDEIADKTPKSLETYLSADTGTTLIAEAVKSELDSKKIKELLTGEIGKKTPESLGTYLSGDEGKKLIESTLKEKLTEEKVKTILIEELNKALQKTAQNRAGRIQANRERAVTLIPTPQVEKGMQADLQRFLNRDDTKDAGRLGRPLAIGVTLRGEYSPEIVEQYIRETISRYPVSEVYILIHDMHGEYIAMCGPVAKQGKLLELEDAQSREEFVKLISSRSEMSSEEFLSSLTRIVPSVASSIRLSDSLEQALLSDAWKDPSVLTDEIPVVDNDSHFVGTTNRGKLIEALIGDSLTIAP